VALDTVRANFRRRIDMIEINREYNRVVAPTLPHIERHKCTRHKRISRIEDRVTRRIDILFDAIVLAPNSGRDYGLI